MRLYIPVTFILLLVVYIKCITVSIPYIDTSIVSSSCVNIIPGYKYELCSPLRFQIDGYSYEVPKHYMTNLPVLNHWWWPFVYVDESSVEAAIIHDYLYNAHHFMRRDEVDAILYNILINDGVSEFTAGRIYFVARHFGINKFHERRKINKTDLPS